MKRTLVTAPAGDAVNLAELLDYLHLTPEQEDGTVAALLDAAVEAVEDYTGRRLLTQTWDFSFDRFADPLVIPSGPVSSITSVSYTDTSEADQTLSTDVYQLAEVHGAPVVRRKYDQTWPTPLAHADAVTVRAVVGYGAASDVPAKIQQAVKLHVTHHWEWRGGEMDLPPAFHRLLDSYRLFPEAS